MVIMVYIALQVVKTFGTSRAKCQSNNICVYIKFAGRVENG
jgi:hypothetical protein